MGVLKCFLQADNSFAMIALSKCMIVISDEKNNFLLNEAILYMLSLHHIIPCQIPNLPVVQLFFYNANIFYIPQHFRELGIGWSNKMLKQFYIKIAVPTYIKSVEGLFVNYFL